MFIRIEGATAITRQRGVFRTSDLFQYKGYVYVKHGTGYAEVIAYNGKFSTSVDGLEVVSVHSDVNLYRTSSYKVCTVDYPTAKTPLVLPTIGEFS